MSSNFLGNWTSTVGKSLGAKTASAVPAADNPFRRDERGEVKSLTAISDAFRASPERAKQLCREAGENPSAWLPENPR